MPEIKWKGLGDIMKTTEEQRYMEYESDRYETRKRLKKLEGKGKRKPKQMGKNITREQFRGIYMLPK